MRRIQRTMRRIHRIMRILKKIMEKKGSWIGGTAPPIFINLSLLFMFFCLFFCWFFVCFWMFSFVTFCVSCGCYDEGFGDGWDQDFFLGLFMFSVFVFIFFVCWLTFGVDVMTRDFQGWLRQGNFFFFFSLSFQFERRQARYLSLLLLLCLCRYYRNWNFIRVRGYRQEKVMWG